MLNLLVIKTKDCVYISKDIEKNKFGNALLQGYLFDGIEAKTTYQSGWYELPQIPSKIELITAARKTRTHWNLKEGYVATEKLPLTINATWDITVPETYSDEENPYYEISNLYEAQYEEIKESVENVEFQISVVESFDGVFKFTKKEFIPEYSLLDKINTHPALLELKPCKLSKAESYGIIRRYIKEHIDTRYAKMVDYDFCLSVYKVIKICKPEPYQFNVNWNKKKPKYETRYRNERETKIYEIAPKAYQSYTIVDEFYGDTYSEMQEKIDVYLKNIMDFINLPIQDCPHCNGMGVINIGQTTLSPN